jgi:fructosamine-3-kinase
MSMPLILPNENIAIAVVEAMTGDKALASTRLITGDQHFVFAINTSSSEYVLRMTNVEQRNKFISAIYWQEKLLPLSVPLAKFIKVDLDRKYSEFPALLMMRLPGDDLCNVYSSLTDSDKRNLANEMEKIQKLTVVLPAGSSYGITDSYENVTEFKSWYDFLVQRIHLFMDIISEAGIFDANEISKVLSIAKQLKEELHEIPATPFLWDASERNVIIHKGKISGIVDVDEVCFGDPLFVLGLTYSALENEGHDTLYTDYWVEALHLDKRAQLRLAFYRLFYIVVFMRKHSMTTANRQKINFNVQRLKNMFQQSLTRINELSL